MAIAVTVIDRQTDMKFRTLDLKLRTRFAGSINSQTQNFSKVIKRKWKCQKKEKRNA